jgi:hypothetical protein
MDSKPYKKSQLECLYSCWEEAEKKGFKATTGTGFDYVYWDCDSQETAEALWTFFCSSLETRGENMKFYRAHIDEPTTATRLVIRLFGADFPRAGWDRRPFGILALSGGGMRGIFQAVVLQRMAEDLPASPALRDRFSMLAGTSTGAIIAASLSLGFAPEEIHSLFVKHGRDIFARRWMAPLRKGGRYRNDSLKALLESRFGNARLGDARPNLLLCATSLEQYGTRAFCSWSDQTIPVADAVLASCSGPSYFPAVPCAPDLRSYVDGGVWANDPSLCAVLEAHTSQLATFEDMWVLSLGNGEVALGSTLKEYNQRSTFSTRMISTILDMMFCTQSSLAATCVTRLLGLGHLLRINAQLPRYIALDDVSSSIAFLPALADKCAADNMERVREKLGLPSGRKFAGFAAPP